MEINIKKERQRFIENYDFNRELALRTEKPHLARWAYGACKEWIKDFQESVFKTETMDVYTDIIKDKKQDLQNLKQELRTKI